jgi:hypothetical protein
MLMTNDEFQVTVNKMNYFCLNFHSPKLWKDGLYKTEENEVIPANEVLTFTNNKNKTKVFECVFDREDGELLVPLFFGVDRIVLNMSPFLDRKQFEVLADEFT